MGIVSTSGMPYMFENHWAIYDVILAREILYRKLLAIRMRRNYNPAGMGHFVEPACDEVSVFEARLMAQTAA